MGSSCGRFERLRKGLGLRRPLSRGWYGTPPSDGIRLYTCRQVSISIVSGSTVADGFAFDRIGSDLLFMATWRREELD